MKKVIPLSIISLLAFTVLVVWLLKPLDQPAHSKGTSLSSLHRPEGVTTETLIELFNQNGFESIDGKNLKNFLSKDNPYHYRFGDPLVLCDTTIESPNNFFIGIEKDTILLFTSHDIMGDDAIIDWQEQIETRSNLVKKLSTWQM